LITRTRQTPIQPASFGITGASGAGAERPLAGEAANGSARAPPPADGESSPGAVAASEPDAAEAIRSQHEVGAPGDLPADGTGLATATSHFCEAAVASAGDPDEASRSQELSLFHPSSPEGANYRDEQAHGNSVDVLVSSISVTLERGNKLECQSSVQVLSRLTSGARLFRSADGRFCAQVPVGERLEIFGLRSAGFRDWLIDSYMNDQAEPPSTWAIRRVIGMLEARARFSVGLTEVFVRVGQDGEGNDSTYFVDLGDPSGRAGAIRDQGWNVVDRPAVHFAVPRAGSHCRCRPATARLTC
jgi:hypothetical protein